ncbi:MAG: putative toxin-antitoxin system toxin component, PIN family [Dolichospermum sp.]
MPSVVLDACVLIPLYLRDTLLTTAEAGLYMPYWSEKILDETTRNIVLIAKKAEKDVSAEKIQNLEKTMKKAFPEAMTEVTVGLEDLMRNDPKDRHVLAAAVIAKADIIVTTNLKDFDHKALTPWNVKAQSPDDFLCELFNEYPDEMVQVIQNQVQRYRRHPRTFLELLDKLSKQIPKFTRQLILYEYSESIFQITNKALILLGRQTGEGGRYLDGKRYQLFQNKEILTITAKDNRGKILQVQNGRIEGNLSSADVEAFQRFEKSLEQQLQEAEIQKSQTP